MARLGVVGVVFVLLSLESHGSELSRQLHNLYLTGSYYKCYQSAILSSKEHTSSAVPDFYAAIALCNYSKDPNFSGRVVKPWSQVAQHLERAKARDRSGKELQAYRKGLVVIQRKLFTVGEKGYREQPESVRKFFDRIARVFDKREGTWRNIYHAGHDASSELYDFVEWDNLFYRLANTARHSAYVSDMAKELIYLHNLCRINPRLFGETYLAQYLKNDSWGESTDHYVTSLQERLRTADPAPLLYPYQPYFRAADSHAKDLSDSQTFAHNSSDGTGFGQRLNKFSDAGGYRAENIQGGTSTPIECFFSLMIDRGVPSYGHRENILQPNLRYIGIGIRDGGLYGLNWVFDFCGRPGSESLSFNP